MIRDFLTRTRTLYALFILAIVITAAVSVVIRTYNLHILDEISDPHQVLAQVAAMTPVQRSAHAWMTGTLDMLFPLTYGLLFVGMALRFFGRLGPLLALCGPAAAFFDFVENIAQILVLNGNDALVGWKQIVTPAKLAFFYIGIAVCIIGLCMSLAQRLLQKAK